MESGHKPTPTTLASGRSTPMHHCNTQKPEPQNQDNFTSSSRASRGRKFQNKKELYSKEKATDQRDAQTISLLWTSLLLLHGGDVTCFDVMKLLAGWDEVMWLVVRWRGEYYWLVATCHVTSCHLMQCDRLSCVMSRDAMRGHGDELLSVVPCNAMECYGLNMPLVARTRHAVRRGSATMWWSKYYSVLQSATTYFIGTTKYYSSKTPYYKVLLQH